MLSGSWQQWPAISRELGLTLLLATLFSFGAALPRVERWEISMLTVRPYRLRQAAGLSLLTGLLFVLSVSYLLGSTFNPFIYFRF
jgi:alginate O-acetyltransferase complex protein AlgI